MEAREYALVQRKILHLTGVDLNGYKSQQIQRRLKTYLLRSGYASWAVYFRAMQNDAEELDRLKDYLAINVTAFFRDSPKYAYLQETILPLLMRGHPKLRVWSAGCSEGHEPYSLAMLLSEATSLYRSHYLLATDIDNAALELAQAGGAYSAEEVAAFAPDWLARYFRPTETGYYVIEALRRKVIFQYHNLQNDPFETGFDLIVCRNVVIYFTQEVKEQLYRQFLAALRPGGVLFVGGTEIVPRAGEVGFTSMGHSFYRCPEPC